MAHPTQAELEILNILWETGEAKVQEVHEKLNALRPIGYTTALKSMQVMVQKGLLDRRPQGRGHVYFPAIKEEPTKTSLLDRFIGTTFRGSSSKLLVHLLGKNDISQAEIEEIRGFLNKIDNQ